MQTPPATIDIEALGTLAPVAAAWEKLGLRLPPVPAELLADVSASDDPLGLASRAVAPNDRQAFLDAAEDLTSPPYVSFGHVGYGLNNHALYLQLVTGPVAVFLRLPFGNVYGDPEEEREAASDALDQVEELVVLAEAAAARGALTGRLVVVHDPVGGSGRGHLPGTPFAPAPDALAATLEGLDGAGDEA